MKMLDTLKRIIMRYPTNHGELVVEPDEQPKSVVCPNCGGNQWYEGPSGGMSINIKCANPRCGLWFNHTPFGLDYIGVKENVGESKVTRWYCTTCKTIIDTTYTSPIHYFPTCKECDTTLKVCWSYEELPEEICRNCEARFKCFTERGNW